MIAPTMDVALGASGGLALVQTLRCLASFGRLMVYGVACGASATLDAASTDRLLYAPASNQSLTGFNIVTSRAQVAFRLKSIGQHA